MERGRSVHEEAVVGLFRFRTLRPAFDGTLRDSLLPKLASRPGLARLWAGRQGPDEIGVRMLVSLWASEMAAVAALGNDGVRALQHGEHEAETADPQLEILPVVASQGNPEPLITGVLRVARGVLLNGDVRVYAQRVSSDLVALPDGQPSSLVIADAGQAAFLMISTWPDWTAIEKSTGASIAEPLRTKRLAGVDAFEAVHYELLLDLVAAPRG